MKRHLAGLVVLSLLYSGQTVFAAELHAGLMERWYSALAVAEREEIAALVAPDAIVELQDLASRKPALSLLPAWMRWADAIKGGSIRHRIDSDSPDTVDVTVCYTFTDNAMMTKESFGFADKQIVSSVQKTVATNCDGF